VLHCYVLYRAIDDNGMNPVYDQKFEFTVNCKELAILSLYVMDKVLAIATV
jgi:hypothetical protein